MTGLFALISDAIADEVKCWQLHDANGEPLHADDIATLARDCTRELLVRMSSAVEQALDGAQ